MLLQNCKFYDKENSTHSGRQKEGRMVKFLQRALWWYLSHPDIRNVFAGLFALQTALFIIKRLETTQTPINENLVK